MATPDDSFSLTSAPDHHSHTAALDAALFADSSATTSTYHHHFHHSNCATPGTAEHQLSWMTTSSTGTVPATLQSNPQHHHNSTTTTTTTTTAANNTNTNNNTNNTSATKEDTTQIFRCTYHDCLREFHRKTSLTNHLKAHKNKNSRSILRSKRMKRNAQRAEEDRRRKLSISVDTFHELGNVISPLHPNPSASHHQVPSCRPTTLGADTSGMDLMPCTSPVSGNGQNIIEAGPSNGQVSISSPSSICNTPPAPSSGGRVRSPPMFPPPMPSVPAYTPQPPPALPSLMPSDWAAPRVVHSISDYIGRDDGLGPPFPMPLPFTAQHELGMPSLVDELPPLQTTATSTNSAIEGYDLAPFLLEPSPTNDGSRRAGAGGAGSSGVFE